MKLSESYKKRMQELSGVLLENYINKNSDFSLRLVEVVYNGKTMKAVAIGFAEGPYFKEVYSLIDDSITFEASNFDEIKALDPSKIILNK